MRKVHEKEQEQMVQTQMVKWEKEPWQEEEEIGGLPWG